MARSPARDQRTGAILTARSRASCTTALPSSSCFALLVPAAALLAMHPDRGRHRSPDRAERSRRTRDARVPGDLPRAQLVLLVLRVDRSVGADCARARSSAPGGARRASRTSPHSPPSTRSAAHVPARIRTTLRRLAIGTTFFRRQGLVGDHFLTIVANLDVRGAGRPRRGARRD